MLMSGTASSLMSPMCGGGGAEDVYELRISSPKVVVATTDNAGTSADTVLYIRGADCVNNSSELACNDDAPMAMQMGASTVTQSIATPGTYYLVVDAHDSGTSGTYDLTVKFLTGEGEVCSGPDDCGPGLVCRIPLGGSQKVCSKHVCNDGVDDDGDGKLDYPTDPGCTSPDDDDESDPCPGAGCPECADGIDNDGDGKIDYPADPTCTSASSASESCVSTDGVVEITTAVTMGDTTTAHGDVNPTCGSSSGTGNDLTYRLDVPALASLTITLDATWDGIAALYNSTCGGTALQCMDTPPTLTLTNVAAGTYYYVVDGYFNDTFDSGPFSFTVSGKIANGNSCESPLVATGALACNTGYACKGTVGSRTCQPALCSDGIDNDGDGKIDYPFDPGCDSPADDTEGNPATLPQCSDGMDNDTDGATDFPADFGCSSAAGTSEVFCSSEHDPTAAITQKTTMGTTMGKANDESPGCRTTTASDVAYGLMLPVPVESLQIDTIGSSYDTVLLLRDVACSADIACDDDSGGSLTSEITLANVAPGGYAIVVDGFSASSGAFTLNVHGTVAPNTPCNFPAFAGGASAILSCPTGTSCSATTHKCQ
jgi:large repetitive protein